MSIHSNRTPGPLAFGIELELMLRPKPSPEMDTFMRRVRWDNTKDTHIIGRHRVGLYRVVQEIFSDTNIRVEMEDDDGPSESTEAFNTWKVTGDASLSGEADGYLGAELVSPILYAKDTWQATLRELYRILSAYFEIKVDRFYGTHVHVSRGLRRYRCWDTRDISSILKAVCLFQGSIFEMLPLNRKDCQYARCNFSHGTAPMALQSLNATAQSSGDYTEIFSFLDSLPSPSAFADLYEGQRYYVFNVSQLKDHRKAYGTVEFRGAPGSPDLQTASHWVGWVLSFMAKAVSTDWSAVGHTTGAGVRGVRVSDLRQFIQHGEALLPATSQGALRSGLLRAVRGPSPFTPADVAAMQEAAEKKDKILKPLLGW